MRIGQQICETKCAYNEEHAQSVVDMALVNRRVMLRKYKCDYCPHWHVTSKSPQNYAKRRRQFRDQEQTG
jgi:hypothetical protein